MRRVIPATAAGLSKNLHISALENPALRQQLPVRKRHPFEKSSKIKSGPLS